MPEAPHTNVVGFQNNNGWPLNLQISELNMTLVVQPGAWVLDRAGRRVNDPLLNQYTAKGLLTRAEGESCPVVNLAENAATGQPGAVAQPITREAPQDRGQHAVREATEFKVDPATNQSVPSLKPTQNVPIPDASKASIHGYSIEDAKRLSLVRPTVDVPEDFGADESDGVPRAGQEIPTIKIARDKAPINPKKLKPLPAELTETDDPAKQALVTSLQNAAQNTNPDAENATAAAMQSAMNAMESTPAPAVPAPQPVAQEPKIVTATPTPPPADPNAQTEIMEKEPVNETAAPGPQNLDSPASTAPLGGTTTFPEPVLEDDSPAPEVEAQPAKPVQTSKTNTKVCSVCSATFKYRSQLKQHAQRKHPDQVDEILAPYPPAQ